MEGFIGLDISAELANNLWKQLKENGVRSVIVPSRYRQTPLLTADAALKYAELLVEQKQNQDPTDKFGELFYVHEDMMWHTFRILSRKLAQEKRSPGSWYINIDKIDGHVWTNIREVMNVTLNMWFY